MSSQSAIAVFPAVGKVAERCLEDLDEIAVMTEGMIVLAGKGDWPRILTARILLW